MLGAPPLYRTLRFGRSQGQNSPSRKCTRPTGSPSAFRDAHACETTRTGRRQPICPSSRFYRSLAHFRYFIQALVRDSVLEVWISPIVEVLQGWKEGSVYGTWFTGTLGSQVRYAVSPHETQEHRDANREVQRVASNSSGVRILSLELNEFYSTASVPVCVWCK